MKPEELVKAIVQGDSRQLESIKGIGKKSAERMVLELKDKLAKFTLESNISPMKYNTLHSDALNALMALGIPRNGAEQAIKRTMESNTAINTIEDLVKQALKSL